MKPKIKSLSAFKKVVYISEKKVAQKFKKALKSFGRSHNIPGRNKNF